MVKKVSVGEKYNVKFGLGLVLATVDKIWAQADGVENVNFWYKLAWVKCKRTVTMDEFKNIAFEIEKKNE